MTHAGTPSAVGGTVAHVFGWLVLGVGTAVALGAGLLAWALFTLTTAAVVFVPIEIIALTVGLLLMKGGQKLQESGTAEQKDARVRAILALAQTRAGILTAADVARATDIVEPDADALLTELAKTQPDVCTLEVDEQGQIFYRFANAAWTTDPRVNARVRVAEEAPAAGAYGAYDARAQQISPGPRVIDAEFIDETVEATRTSQKAR